MLWGAAYCCKNIHNGTRTMNTGGVPTVSQQITSHCIHGLTPETTLSRHSIVLLQTIKLATQEKIHKTH